MRTAFTLVTIVLILAGAARAELIGGQIDDFEGGTTENWTNGFIAADPVLETGGPGGLSDHYMKVSADGMVGAGGRLIVFNRSQWVGDYITPGVAAIEMDLKNLGSATLSMRIAFKQTTTQFSPGYVTTTGFSLPAGPDWLHAVFAVDASAMTGIGLPPAFDTLMTAPVEMRILHSAGPALNGDVIASQVAVDNITLIPEPVIGDANLSGFVDDDDLSLLLANWNVGDEWGEGDFNESGTVDDDDLSLLLANWGAGSSPAPAAVPEPVSLLLLALGGAAMLRQRRS